MTKKTNSIAPAVLPKENRPPRFEDFLKPNPFIWPWMLPYLPSDARVRDVIMIILGSFCSLMIAGGIHELGATDLVSGTILTIGAGIVQGDSLSRNVIAGINLKRAKQHGIW